jgi:hypothetical protein
MLFALIMDQQAIKESIVMHESQQSTGWTGHLRRAEKALIVVLSISVFSTLGAAMTALFLRLEPDAAEVATRAAERPVATGTSVWTPSGTAVPTLQ